MSEVPLEELGHRFNAALEPEISQAEVLVFSDDVKTFLECAFAPNPFVGLNYFKANEAVRVAAETRDLPELGGLLSWVMFIVNESRSDVLAIRDGLAPPNTSDESQIEAVKWQAALRWLKRGPEKIMHDALSKGSNLVYLPEETREKVGDIYEMLFPVTLALLALDALESQNDNYEVSMAQFQADALAIQQGQKLRVVKDDPRMESYARAMNMLKDFYWRSTSDSFIKRFTEQGNGQIVSVFMIGSLLDLELENVTTRVDAAQKYAESRRFVAQKLQEMAKPFGIDGVDFSVLLARMDLRTARQASQSSVVRKANKNTKEGIYNHDVTNAVAGSWHVNESFERMDSRFEAFLRESERLLVTRSLVDAIAAGQIDFRTVIAASEALDRKPFAENTEALITDDELVDWEFMPPEEMGPREPAETDREPTDRERLDGFDQARVDELRRYIAMWGRGRIARSRIPNLPEDEQYYLAILPQSVGSLVIEHAIGDNPQIGRHAIYMWRAEKGMGRFGQIQLTWREVFRYYKSDVRRFGGKKILHTGPVDDKIVDYLTRPPHLLDSKRYFF